MARGNFGERLKRERELREVSLKEITSATRIGPRFLEALENEDWEKLPGGVFNRGFVRSVARYLGLDEESFLAEYDLAHGPVISTVPDRPNKHHLSSRPKWIPFVAFLVAVALLIALLFLGIYLWRHYDAPHTAKQPVSVPASIASAALWTPAPPVAPLPTPATSPSRAPVSDAPISSVPDPLPVPVRSVPLDLYVSLSAPTHLRITADGRLLLNARMPSGRNRHFPAKNQFTISAGNSSAVLLELNGQAMPPLGAPGSSGTITLSHKDLRPATSGNSQP